MKNIYNNRSKMTFPFSQRSDNTRTINANMQIQSSYFEYDLFNLEIFNATNQERIKHGCQPFQYSSVLTNSSTLHCNEMGRSVFFDHINPYKTNLKTPLDRVLLSGGKFNLVGENIADYPTIINDKIYTVGFFGINMLNVSKAVQVHSYKTLAIRVVEGWMNSPGHRANILNKQFSFIGCGCALHLKKTKGISFDYVLCTQNFGGI